MISAENTISPMSNANRPGSNGHSRQPSRKRIQNKDGEDDPRSWKQNREHVRSVYQRPRRTKEQTEMNNTLEGINSRITEAEGQISDWEGRMVEITATKQNKEEKWMKIA